MELLHDPEFWVGVGFVLVLLLLAWKGVPGMVGKMLDQRAQVIAAELEEARRLRAEAAALLADYQKRRRAPKPKRAALWKRPWPKPPSSRKMPGPRWKHRSNAARRPHKTRSPRPRRMP